MGRAGYKCAEETRDRLIAAIIVLVRKKGYAAVTVRDICRESGVSNGAFYYHYGSKDALTRAAYHHMDRILTSEALTECSHLPPLEGLRMLIEKHLRYVTGELGLVVRDYYKVLLGGDNARFFDHQRPYYQAMLTQVKLCLDRGLLQGDAEEIADHFIRFSRGLIFDWCLHDGDYDLPALFLRSFPALLGGLIPRPA